MVREWARSVEERGVPLSGDRVRAVDGQGGDERRHRPVLARAHHGLDALGRGRPRRSGREAGAVVDDAGTEAGPGGRFDDLRTACPRLLDQRQQRAGRTPRHVSRLRRRGQRHEAPAALAAGRSEHGAPAADVRHRVDPGGPGQQTPACDLSRSRRTPSSSRPA